MLKQKTTHLFKRTMTVLWDLLSSLARILKGLLRFLYRHLRVTAALILVVFPVLFFSYYFLAEETTFPEIDTTLTEQLVTATSMTDMQKGVVLSSALSAQLERELSSAFGWSANDIAPTGYLDNRKKREEGIIFATKMLTTFFSVSIAKLGKGEDEHSGLKAARDTYFVYQATKYWFPSSERQYRLGISNIRAYEKDLKKAKAVYNLRSDDVYKLLIFIISESFLGEPLGRLSKHNEEVSFFEIDDHIYYSQGVVLVVRDFLETLITLYPEYLEKGGRDNFKAALRDMELISTFNPIIVLGGKHDSIMPDHRAKMNKYYFTLIERLKDIAESINR